MYFEEFRNIIEKKISPKSYCLNKEFYGIQYGNYSATKYLKRIMITSHINLEAIHFAIKNKIDLILTYIPLLGKPIDQIDKFLIKKLNLLTRYPVSIFVINQSYISAEEGLSDIIAKVLFLKVVKLFTIDHLDIKHVPIGRICTPEFPNNKKKDVKLKEMIKRCTMSLRLNNIRYMGNLERSIHKLCVIGGSNFKLDYLKSCLELGVDCFLSSNISYQDMIFADESGLCIIDIPEYVPIRISLTKLYNLFSLEFPNDEFFLYESEDLLKNYSIT